MRWGLVFAWPGCEDNVRPVKQYDTEAEAQEAVETEAGLWRYDVRLVTRLDAWRYFVSPRDGDAREGYVLTYRQEA